MKNQRIIELYERHQLSIAEVGSRCEGKMYGPFLISPSDAYWNSTTKVAFVGQETHEWSSEREISAQLKTYSNFNLGERYYSSPFWNVIRKLENKLTDSTYSSAWLNLNRYDQAGKRPSWKNQTTLSELDFLLLEELKLIGADIVIFFTGPFYEQRITTLLQPRQIPINGFSPRQLCQIESPVLGGTIFRTYHPSYLRRSGLESKIIDAIAGKVTRAGDANHL